MILDRPGQALRLVELPRPQPGAGEVLIEVEACGVCRTDLHLVDGELPHPALPIIPGHEIVGRVAALGSGVAGLARRRARRRALARLDLRRTAATAASGRENLCDAARFTGYQIATAATPSTRSPTRAIASRCPTAATTDALAPLLCAGLIGYRALRDGRRGAPRSASTASAPPRTSSRRSRAPGARGVRLHPRPATPPAQDFARGLGAAWAGGSDERAAAEPLDAALIFAPVGALVPAALRRCAKGGRVVCAGIHMSDIPSFPYALLWGERSVRSVANLTRRDGEEFLALAPQVPVRTTVHAFPLAQANEALARLRRGALQGAAVLAMHE